MRNRDPFGAVLAELRHQVRNGAFADGAPLPVTDLAARLGVSQTPVREALAYLAGEGLIDGRQGQVRGYHMWRAEPEILTDLLRLHQAQVMIALAAAPTDPDDGGRSAQADLTDPVVQADLAEAIFGRWVAQGGGEALRRAQRLVAERLRLMRLREARVLEGIGEELSGLQAAGPGAERAAAVRAYHRRRLLVVGRLTIVMR